MAGIRSRTAWTTGLLAASIVFGALTVPAGAVTGDAAVAGTSAFTAKLNIGNGSRSCTGVVVDAQWILTASSCFVDDPQAGSTVPAGAPKLKTFATIGRSDLSTTAGTVVEVTELVPRTDRDLVLAKLATSVAGLTPLVAATTAPVAGEQLRAVGFGRTKDEWVPNQAHTAAFTAGALTETSLDLAGAAQGAALCKGDTGAPILRDRDGLIELAAIATASWQGGCLGTDETRTGAVATRVDDLGAWLKEKTFIPDIPVASVAINNVVHTFAIGTGGVIYSTDTNYANGTWTKWAPLPGTNIRQIAAAATGNTVHIYAVGADGAVYAKDGNYTTGAWSAWTTLPASGIRQVAATATGNTVRLFVVSNDGTLSAKSADYTTGAWSAWTTLPASGIRQVAATATGNTVRLFVVSNDGTLSAKSADYTTGAWSAWTTLPASGIRQVAATATGNTVRLFAVSNDGTLSAKSADYTTGAWSAWTTLPASGIRQVAATATGNTVRLYAVAADSIIYVKDGIYPADTWSGWNSIETSATAGQLP